MAADPLLTAVNRTGVSTLFFELASAPAASRLLTAFTFIRATASTSGAGFAAKNPSKNYFVIFGRGRMV